MKKKFISLLLAFFMLVTTLPVPALAQEVGPASEELEKLDYEFERIDGQDYLKVTLPANSVEVVEDPYVIRPMSITDKVPTQGGAGHLINWGTGVVWNVYDKNDSNKLAPFPPTGKKPYEVKLTKELNGKNVVIGKVTVSTATEFEDDIKPDKPTTYQFVTTENYELGDENKELSAEFPIELEMNLLYEVAQSSAKGPIGNNHEYNLIFLIVTRLTSPTYTAEWDKTTDALQPTVKGKIVTGKNNEATVDVFKEDGKYGTICNKPTLAYVDEKDKAGKLIGEIEYDKKGSLDIKSVLWTKGSTPVMSGQFLSYSTKNIDEDGNVTTIDHDIEGTKGLIPAHYATMNDGVGKKYTPPYFYNLVGDNDHMWRFQLKEGLEVKFNTGVGSETEGGQAGQDIGQASTIAYGEKFDTNLKGAFSENTISLPTVNPVAPKLNKNNVNLTFKGWKLVQGLEVPVNPQKIEKDNDGKETLTDVTPDYGTTDALKAALSDSKFKGFTGKNPVFYAIFGQTQGKANINYVDDKGTDLLKDDLKIDGQDYKTEKLGELNETVTATIDEAPQFKGYAINRVEISPANGTYVDPARATIKFVYKVKATTEDKSSDNDYIKVTFDANEGHFGQTTTDKTKDVWVYSGKATFADAKEKVSNPSKDNADFKEWQTDKTSGQTVADDKTLSTAGETFYANYEEKLPGKATVEYLDVKTGKAIEDKYRTEDAAKYPAEKEGKQGDKISADVYTKDTAPKFVGYEFNRVEISPKDGAYALPGTSVIKVYYNKLDDIIPDNTPDTDDDKPDGYVTVKFLADDATHTGENARGTLSGKTKFYVNPKAEKKNSDLTEPIIKAKTGFTVKENDEKWSPKFDKTSTEFITADATYTAQYTDGNDVIPVPDPSNPPDKPAGYVTVTFDLDGKGTTTDTRVFFVNPNKDVTLTAPKVTGINYYEQKTGDDAWSPKFVTKAKYDKDTTFVAQYNFTKDVVPQGPGEDKPVVPDNYVKVTFKEGDHGVISASRTTIYWVNPDKEVTLTAPVVTANAEYKHTAWKYNVNNQDKITSGTDATKTVKDTFAADTDITAQYKKKVVDTEPKEPGTDKPDPDYVKVDFKAETNGKIKDGEKTEYWVLKDETVELKTPAVEPNANYAFEKWNPAVQTSYSEDKTHNAVFKYTGDDVVPQKPGEETPDVPDNFVEVVFAQGDHGTIAADATTTYWVNPEKEVTLTAPTVTANDGYKHVAWTYGTKEETNLQSVTDKFTEKKTTITAKYLKKVVTDDPNDTTNYVKVSFSAEKDGKFADGATTTYWVLKDTPVSLTEPKVTANAGWKFIKFEPAVKDSYSEDTVHKAQYKKIIVTEDPKDKDYVKVTFNPAAQGTIKAGSNAEVWVLKDETIDPKDITPELDIKEGYALEKWDPAVQNKYDKDTKHTAIYKYNGDNVVPQKPGDDKPNVPDNFVKVEFTKGEHGIISSEETTIYWVNPKATDITVTAPKVTADPDWKHTGWKPEVKTAYTEAITHVAQYKEKVVTTDPGDKDYVKLTFKAEANGKFAGNKTESYVWVLKDTEVKVTPPEVIPNSGYTFTEWSPAVKTIYSVDTEHKAQYKEKDKVVTEDPNDKDYIKVTFNANGGKIGTKATKDLWVLKDIATFADAKERVATPTKDKATFKEWQDKASEGTKVEDAKVLSTADEIFYAAWTDKDKIIEDPTTPQPEDGYVRLTFKAGEGTFGKDAEDKDITQKQIDVLKDTSYTDKDLLAKIKEFEYAAKATDTTKKFNAWSPAIPATGLVAEETFTAQYVDKDKIIDKDPDNPGEVQDGYIRFVFDANTKDNKITGKIGEKQKAIFDVLKGTKFSDSDLQAKINGITPLADNKVFKAWDPAVLNNDTLVENATQADGMSADKTTITYNATYKDKDADIIPGDQDKPDGYVTVRFLTNKNGTLTGQTTYYVNPKAGKKMSDITAPTITANDGYKVATPNWKPEFTDDTPITEDKNFVANYDSVNPSPTTFEINYISIDTKMGKVNPASETVAIDENSANGTITGSTAKAEEGYEFVKWIDDKGTQVSTEAKLVPTARKSATYIAVFKEKVKETTADKVKKLYDFEGVDLAAFVGDKLTSDFWKDGVKTTEKSGSTLTDDEKAAINTALENATVTDLSERNTEHEVLSPTKGRLQVKFEDGSTIIVEQKLYVYGNGSEKPQDPNQPTPKDEVDVTYKAGEGVESFTDKVVMVKKGTKEADLPGKPDAKAKDGFKDLKWTANPEIDEKNGIQANTTLTASAGIDHDFAKTSFTVKKVWPNDVNDVPTMNFTLYRKVENGTEEKVQGAEVKTITKDVTEATWDNLAKTNSEGKAYTYSVKESFAEKDAKNDNWILGTMETDGEGNNTITNKLKTVPGEGDKPDDDENFVGKLTITKKLENEPVSAQTMGMRRAPAPVANDPVKFKFKVTGPYGYKSEEFELAANESKTLENLAYGDYKVEEIDAKGYTPEYSKTKETLTKDSPSGTITVTNKNKESTDPQKPNENIIDVTVYKVWANVPQGTNTPQVKIELWRKGYDLSNKEYEQKVGEFTTAADNSAAEETKKFENLAKHDPSGKEFTYYAVEANVPANYIKTENGLTVTNTYQTPPTPATEFKVTYVKGAEAATGIMAEVKVKENTDYTILGNGFEYADHNFTGWKVEGTEEIKQPGDVIEITKDVKLIAQWEEKTVTPEPTEFTIKYISADTNQGTVNPAQEVVAIDATAQNGTIAGSTATANAGYKFVKWIDTNGTTKSTDAIYVPTDRKDATYIAVFEKEETVTPQPTDFTIKYISANTDQGTVSPASETVAMTGGTINGSTATAISGYKFVKWIDTNGSIKSTDANFVPTERISATYIAVFEKVGSVIPPTPSDTFTIHYVARYDDMGWVSRDYEVVENPYGDIMGSTAIARNGYRFVKWVDEYGDTVSRFERFVPYERREATYFAIFERDYPYDPYYPDHRPDDRPNRPDDRHDRDDRDDDTVRKPEDTRPVLDHEAYMFGYTDGTVRPNGNITRAEAAALVTRLLGIEAYASAAKPNFPDTPSAWYNKAINAAVERGIMKGYPDGRFRPNAPITRAEFTQMISTIDNKPYGVAPFADVVGHWAERPIGSEYQAGRITGYPDGLFRPNAYITRCEAVVILNKIFERKYDELSPINAINAERIKRFIDLTTSFWGYNDMVEATNSHSFKRRVQGRIEEDWVLVK
ncbi:MAG: S-layer homology domain-containing protein [Eubacteriales bacterium]|uniref:S-layer homology domain-containing protein n=1 Tax=Fenollaria sp. TaxID=1965292 RepID=UPI002A751411|nr:S-layer homology domain-containing protein [Fenollaria sp.]MDD7340050.1 S-layer homology domain-containing protein [Eubacteriales bacterium]MDY3105982.1 S-layer homology domain-containing protein [Fenollaria sp.]